MVPVSARPPAHLHALQPLNGCGDRVVLTGPGHIHARTAQHAIGGGAEGEHSAVLGQRQSVLLAATDVRDLRNTRRRKV